ncbi:HS12A-like protein [Mya arenaria]|uniref:HS12A-like protein n=1 Tax=Mya arenaria TaxID=6604 RepID=A0ABY7EJS5_MYAAR|nr:HS12A-like protein [Mya arenaria]
MNIVGAQSISELPVGHRYILADLGGGTVDICAHEILPKAELKELWHVSGGAFGGERVDFEFEQYLIKIFGGPVWSEFKCEYPSCYLEMIEEFETAKTRFDGKRESKLKIQKAFTETIKTHGEESFEDSIAAFKTEVQYDKNNQILVIGANKMKALFHHSVKGILETIEQVLQKSSAVESLLLVGGYAESQYVREEIKNAFSHHVKIVLEQSPQLAVMKGAVKMGYTPKNIIARKSKFTFGFASTKPFNPRFHNSDLMVTRNGKSFCDDVFEVLIEVGQELVYNASFPSTSREYLGTELKGQDIFFTIYRSTERKPEYCIESETCQKVGELRMKSPAGGWPKSVKFNRNITVDRISEFADKDVDAEQYDPLVYAMIRLRQKHMISLLNGESGTKYTLH